MAEPFIASIIMFGGNFGPRGWALCQGQILSIAQNTALFSLLGTTYGGNGQTTFALPDLRSRVPVGQGQGPGLSSYSLGQQAGTENVTLTTAQMPAHTHTATATSTLNASTTKATLQTPVADAVFGKAVDNVGTAVPLIYCPAGTAATVPLAGAGTVTNSITGGSQPHNNIQPYLCINFIIALEGIFPSRN